MGSGNDLRRACKEPLFVCLDRDGRTGEEPAVDGVCGDDDPSDDSGLEGSNSGTADR